MQEPMLFTNILRVCSDHYNNVLNTIFGRSNYNAVRKYTVGLLLSISVYIISPSITRLLSPRRDQAGNIEKRKDKFTTGLLNTHNDCFVNSSLQALSCIDSLTLYLNEYLTELTKLTYTREQEHFKLLPKIHVTLSQIILQLQELITENRVISKKPIIQALESIFRGPISTLQNDAHEFTQLLLELLEKEYSTTSKIFPGINFPFKGETSTQFRCLRCKRLSKLKFESFLISEVKTPQQYSVRFTELLQNSQSEIIEDYSCMYCQIKALLSNEVAYPKRVRSDIEESFKTQLEDILPNCAINENISDDLLCYIKQYNVSGCQPSKLKSSIVRQNLITHCPDILVVHLSRSVFNGMNFSRNPCRVAFDEEIQIKEHTIINGQQLSSRDVSYHLRSVIKHTGSHYQGHYQCYRHKPDLVIRKNDNVIINSSPQVRKKTVMSLIGGTSSNAQDEVIQSVSTSKYRTLRTLKRYPFWHISDGSVKESKTETVLNENKYVYMLYYEKYWPST